MFDYAEATMPVLRTSTGYHLLWAVSLVAQMARDDAVMKSAACAVLHQISEVLHIGQALHFANDLEKE